MRIAKLLEWIIVKSLEWITGYPRRPRRGNHFMWERKDLIDPPLRSLPPTRPRALTDTSQTHPQLQSALIARLPPEIRILIWAHVVGPEDARDVLHIEVGDGTLRQNRCYQQGSTAPGYQHDCWNAPWREAFRKGGAKGRRQPDGCFYDFLPLLFTCKLM
jgi:hypothetical protein